MPKLSVSDLAPAGQRVLLRVDFNVPLGEQDGRMVITDETRIIETLPTIRLLISRGARTILAAHLGRPDGKREPTMSLAPVAARLGELLGQPVAFAEDCVGASAEAAVAQIADGGVLLLENVRYYAAEEANDPAFAAQLAALCDVYVNDAFGAAHRAHASTAGVAAVVAARGGPCAAGLLMQRELQFLGDELENPARPFVVILGGAKVSDKIKVIDRLLERADAMIIGGAMAYTFKLAQGRRVGKSLVEPDKTGIALAAIEKAKARGVNLLLPVDNVVATPVKTDRLNKKGKPVIELRDPRVNTAADIPDDVEGVDIGPASIAAFNAVVAGAGTILWNGPMGIFEDPRFAVGTFAVARAVADATARGAKSIIGGGDSVKAVNQAKLKDKVTFASTGGGASLEFLEGNELPGVAALTGK
jgi:phosphoglycerate kinase